MPEHKAYLDYKFMGVQSFIESLDEAKAEYRLFDQDDFRSLFDNNPDLLTEDDTIKNGFVIRDDTGLYFTEFGLKITKSYHSYIVFIFNHHPSPDDLQLVVQELTTLVEKHLDGVDIEAISQTITNLKNNQN